MFQFKHNKVGLPHSSPKCFAENWGCLWFFPSPPILVHKIKCNVIIFYHGYNQSYCIQVFWCGWNSVQIKKSPTHWWDKKLFPNKTEHKYAVSKDFFLAGFYFCPKGQMFSQIKLCNFTLFTPCFDRKTFFVSLVKWKNFTWTLLYQSLTLQVN